MKRRSRRYQGSIAYVCPHCGQVVETEPDCGGGFDTNYIETCPVCSRANRIHARFNEDQEAMVVEVTAEL